MNFFECNKEPVVISEDSPEAILSLETTIKERDLEIQALAKELSFVRNFANKENRLMMSAWYKFFYVSRHNLGMKMQRESLIGGVNKGQASPVTWLGKQRKNIEQGFK